MVDSIDTMILMGLDELVNKSLVHVAKMDFDQARCRTIYHASQSCSHDQCRTPTSNSLKPSFGISAACSPHTLCQARLSSSHEQMISELPSSQYSIPPLDFPRSVST